MIFEKDRCEVLVIGAGPAGIACAYTLAQSGVNVVVLERGEYPGAKNMFGGIFFSSQLSNLLPEFLEEAPWERFVAKRRFSLLIDGSEIAFSFSPHEFKEKPHNNCFIAKRPKFDKWFASQAESRGATILTGICVRDFLWEGDKVIGIISGRTDENKLLSDVVVCAEGANSLLSQKAGLRNRLSARSRIASVKETLLLPQEVIEERFALAGKEGAAYEYFGEASQGMLGNGFIYTNKDSISVGVSCLISELYRKGNGTSLHSLLENFKKHPAIAPLLKGAEVVEYAAHMLPADGYNNLPALYTDGLLLVGDAAGLVNNSFFHEGVNLAMASGIMAAETILAAREKKIYDKKSLQMYEKKLAGSFVLHDLKDARHFLDYLNSNKEFMNDYPHAVKDALLEYFEVSSRPKKSIKKSLINKVKSKVNLIKALKDFTTMLKVGI